MLFTRKSENRQDPPPSPTNAPHPMLRRAPAGEAQADGRVPRGADGPHTQSFIDAPLTIVGDLHSEGDVRIDGRICGNVRCAQLVLGREAVITGSVIAEQVIVRGRIIGTIRAPAVVIQDTAHVESEITYGSLAIDDGAFFEGAARRRDNPLAEPAASALLELQRAAQSEAAPRACAESTEPAAAISRPSLPDSAAGAPAAGGKAPITNGRAPIAHGHTTRG
jgi:cytoskeletal protein CcmA (bactofilin family)